jgi:tRNA A37 N6-isopentenylltransferase MiaA
MAAQLLQDIFRLAKRQDTWFRGMERRGMAVRTVPRADFGIAMEIINQHLPIFAFPPPINYIY